MAWWCEAVNCCLGQCCQGCFSSPQCPSYQIRKIVCCACAGGVSPATDYERNSYLAIPHASRHVRNARAVMHVGIAHPRRRGKRSRHSRRIHTPQFCVSDKRPMRHQATMSERHRWHMFSARCDICGLIQLKMTVTRRANKQCLNS